MRNLNGGKRSVRMKPLSELERLLDPDLSNMTTERRWSVGRATWTLLAVCAVAWGVVWWVVR